MLHLHLPIKPYSVNAYFYGNRAIKKREAVEWEQKIIEFLRTKKIQSDLNNFRNNFDPSKHSISVDIKLTYPPEILYTQKQQLSAKAFDISNTEKPLIDVLFLSKYSTEKSKNIEIDDKYITRMTSEKVAGDSYCIDVKIQLLNLPHLEDK